MRSVMLEEDEPLLRQKAKDCKDAEEKIRYYALHAVSRGDSITETAERFLVERQTVHDWINRWQEEKNLGDKPRSGRPEKITEEDEQEIHRLIDENDPKKYGINSSSYTTKELQIYFIKFRGKSIAEETFRVHLLKTGAHYVKAQLRYKEADLNKQVEFARGFQSLLTNYGFTKIIFVDEMSVSTSAHNGYGWTYNQRLLVDAPQSKVERANYFGAVEVLEGEIIETVRKSAKTPSFLHLLHKIEEHYPDDKILVVMDNSKVHHDKRVDKFFDKRYRMKQLYLSPYSPELNPEEYIHNVFRDKLLDNCNFRSIRQIGHTISHFARRMTSADIRNTATLLPIEALLSV